MPTGLDDMLRNLRAFGDRTVAAAVGAVDEFAEVVLAESKDLCPVSATNPFVTEEVITKSGRRVTRKVKNRKGKPKKNPYYNGHPGKLRDSGVARPATLDAAGRIGVELGYGGGTADYAAAVHENLKANHKYPGAVNPQAQAKFLEVPLVARGPDLLPHVADAVKAVIG